MTYFDELNSMNGRFLQWFLRRSCIDSDTCLIAADVEEIDSAVAVSFNNSMM